MALSFFLPFTNYRVAFNNISVADPLYTFPFLVCLIVSLFIKREKLIRKKWVFAGIYISSFYMLFTIVNKFYIHDVFKQSFKNAHINYKRFSAQPTILNNALWYAVAEREDDYVVTFYSVFDTKNRATKFTSIPKNHSLIDIEHPDIKTLRWFSKDYFSFSFTDSTKQIVYKDLRYPLLDEDNKNSSLFTFELVKDNDRFNTKPYFDGNIKKEDFNKFINRIFGN